MVTTTALHKHALKLDDARLSEAAGTAWAAPLFHKLLKIEL